MSPKAASFARKAGYKKVKVYLDGMPAWKKAKNKVVVNGDWLAENLNEHHVIIDVRDLAVVKKAFIPTAVNIPLQTISELGKSYANKMRGKKKGELYAKRILPGLPDKSAPIIVYSSNSVDKKVLQAYQELVSWRYKKVAVLDGGIEGWKKRGRMREKGEPAKRIQYVKKLVKGAVTPSEFVKVQKDGSGVILDVRQAQEAKKGTIQGAVNIPLDELEKELSKLSKNDKIIAHCSTGVRAEIAYETLKKNGFDKAGFLNNIVHIDKKGGFKIE